MTVVVDSKEKEKVLLDLADERRHLRVLSADGHNWSYDFRVTTGDGETLKVERKALDDYISSWMDGKLDRQVSYVDLLVVEWDPVQAAFNSRWSEEVMDRGRRHLAHLAFKLPVIVTSGPDETVDVLRYLERKGVADVRGNEVIRTGGRDVRQKMLSVLPNINVERRLQDGRTVGDALVDIVDWEALVQALHLERWRDVPGIGNVTCDRIGNELDPDSIEEVVA